MRRRISTDPHLAVSFDMPHYPFSNAVMPGVYRSPAAEIPATCARSHTMSSLRSAIHDRKFMHSGDVMLNLRATTAVIFLCAITCGATFLFALYRQFALVEVASSMITMVEVYLLSSSIGDLIEGKREVRFIRLVVAVALALFVVTYFTISKLTHH